MENLRARLQPYAPLFLRVGIGVVFLLFSWQKLNLDTFPQARAEIEFISGLGLGSVSLVTYYMGIFEFLVALSFFVGFAVRWTAPFATILLAFVFASVVARTGFTNDPGLYRDLGMIGGALALWLLGAGPVSLDARRMPSVERLPDQPASP